MDSVELYCVKGVIEKSIAVNIILWTSNKKPQRRGLVIRKNMRLTICFHRKIIVYE